jgi:hypothetical protein
MTLRNEHDLIFWGCFAVIYGYIAVAVMAAAHWL